MECWEARHTYAEAITDRTPIEALDSAVREHLRHCPRCMGLLRRLVQVVAAPSSDCAAIRPRLLDYAEAELRGEGSQPHFAGVRLHLDVCVDCALDFALVTESLTHGSDAAGQPSMQMPAVDLSFLTQRDGPPALERPAGRQLWETALRWEGPRRAVLQLSTHLLDAVAAWQRPASISASRAAAGAQQLWRLQVPGEHGALQITITAEEQRRNPANVDLFFDIEDVERGGWPNLAGIEVECRWGKGELRRVVTDAFGKAVVAGIPAAELASLSLVVDAERAA